MGLIAFMHDYGGSGLFVLQTSERPVSPLTAAGELRDPTSPSRPFLDRPGSGTTISPHQHQIPPPPTHRFSPPFRSARRVYCRLQLPFLLLHPLLSPSRHSLHVHRLFSSFSPPPLSLYLSVSLSLSFHPHFCVQHFLRFFCFSLSFLYSHKYIFN